MVPRSSHVVLQVLDSILKSSFLETVENQVESESEFHAPFKARP